MKNCCIESLIVSSHNHTIETTTMERIMVVLRNHRKLYGNVLRGLPSYWITIIKRCHGIAIVANRGLAYLAYLIVSSNDPAWLI